MITHVDSLVAKRDEAVQKAKQLEADLYFMQGYIKSLDELIESEREQENNLDEQTTSIVHD